MTDGHLFWIASRASGTVALLLSSAAVAFGLMQGMRLLPRAKRDLRPLHEALSPARPQPPTGCHTVVIALDDTSVRVI
jgi:hypothetical protein